ncbi:MAG: hypothetical protein FWG99_01440 [Treponema sp.]|nr:hypothetical protein [Treponema sp.]
MIKNRLILTGLIVGLLILICLIWIFSRPLQTQYLMRTINRNLIASEYSGRLASPLDKPKGNFNLLGYWYSIVDSSDTMFVFTVFNDGILIPYGARISVTGEVMEIMPLSFHARQVHENIPESFIRIYKQRIEAGVQPR